MDSSSIWFMILTGSAIVILCLCTAVLVCNYLKRNELSSEQKIWQNSLVGGMMAFVIFTYPIFYWVEKPMDALSLWLRVIPIIMGVLAFLIAFLNFQRKSGISFHSYYQIVTNSQTKMPTVGSVWLKNNKDRNELLYEIF